MDIMIESVRKLVVLVALVELILQLQISKKYESFIKLSTRIMIICCIGNVLFQWVGVLEGNLFEHMEVEDFSLSTGNVLDVEDEVQEGVQEISIGQIDIPDIYIEKID